MVNFFCARDHIFSDFTILGKEKVNASVFARSSNCIPNMVGSSVVS